MNCPVCGGEMEPGSVTTSHSRGLFFLPPGGTDDFLVLTRKRIERQNGVVLDGPYNSKLNLPNETRIPACLCRKCRKIVMEYGGD